MIKILFFFSFFLIAHADIIDYYHKSLQTLQYNKTYTLYKQADRLKAKSVTYSQYANFALDGTYANTHAHLLSDTFHTTDIALSDTFDLFAKQSYKIEALSLDVKAKQKMLDSKKEQLFISLVTIISYYHTNKAVLKLNQSFFAMQQKSYHTLQRLLRNGSIKNIDLLRFKTALTTLQSKIIHQKNNIEKMKKQLHLYAPDEQIPRLPNTKLRATQKNFLQHNPHKALNHIQMQKLYTKAEGLEKNYLPDVSVVAAYQQLGDPTGYGNNYALAATIHIPINSGDFKQSEALKVQALSKQSKAIGYELERKKEFIAHQYTYLDASKQLKALQKALKEYEKSQRSTKKAFMQGYVDLTTYLQVMTQTLDIKEHIIALKYQKRKEATILNDISNGTIYE